MIKLNGNMELQTITSRENRRLVLARKVRDGKERGLMFIEGRRLANEAIRSGINIEHCFVEKGSRVGEQLDPLIESGIMVSELTRPLFRSIADTEESQGIVILAKRPDSTVDPFEVDSSLCPVFLFLQQVSNPSNLGAILRSAEAAGVKGIFISKNSADVYSPKALRASMGSAFRTKIAVGSDLADVVERAKLIGAECLAIDTLASESYLTVYWKRPHLLVFGSEGHGLSSADIDLIGGSVAIPMEEGVESLNLAVAAGIILFEARRQLLLSRSSSI